MFDSNVKGVVRVISIAMVISFIIFIIGASLASYYIFIDPISKGKVTATIVEIDDKTKVTYNVDGREYEKTYNVYSSTYYVGKKIKVYYEKYNPHRSKIANMRYLWLIAPGIGVLLLGITGVALLIVYMKYYIKHKT